MPSGSQRLIRRPGPRRRKARASDVITEEAPVTWDELLAYCLAKPGAWQDEPWDGDVVAKVGSKIFAFLGSEHAGTAGLKCGPTREAADEWLLRYPGDASVMAYIGRSGWNSLRVGGAIPDDELLEAVDASYEAVVSKLPRKDRPPARPGRHRGE
jgi:predicted DNA-binding protein (MmcQ/YjbR family)